MPRGYPGSTPGADPRSQGVISRRFKRKKNFVTNERTNERTDGWTDRRVGRNSDLDNKTLKNLVLWVEKFSKTLLKELDEALEFLSDED